MFLTSFNNMLAFFMAALIPIPALRYFAIQVKEQFPDRYCPSSDTQGLIVGTTRNKMSGEIGAKDRFTLCPFYFASPRLSTSGSPRMNTAIHGIHHYSVDSTVRFVH